MESLSFAEIRRLKKRLGPDMADMSMNDFSTSLDSIAGQGFAEQGKGNAFETGVKSYSAGVDDFLDKYAGGVNDKLGDAGAGLFKVFGADEATGREVGEEALRGVADFLPAIGGMALAPFTGGGTAIAGLAATGALGAANAYEKTDSLGQTALAAAMPFAGGPLTSKGAALGLGAVRGTIGKTSAGKALGMVGGDITKKAVQRKVKDQVIEGTLETLKAVTPMDRLVGAASGEAFMNAAMMTAGSVVDFTETGEWTNPFTKENMLANLVDPTIVFGVRELIKPTKISEHIIDKQVAASRYVNADHEENTAKVRAPDLTLHGESLRAVTEQFKQHEALLNNIKDPELRAATKVLLEEARSVALENSKTQTPEEGETLFGESIVTQLEQTKSEPITETVMEGDVATEREVVALDVMTPEVFDPLVQNGFKSADAVRVQRMLDSGEAKTREEWEGDIKDANATLDVLQLPLIAQSNLQKRIDAELEKGASMAEAVTNVGQGVKAETYEKTRRKRKPPLVTDDVIIPPTKFTEAEMKRDDVDTREAKEVANEIIDDQVIYEPEPTRVQDLFDDPDAEDTAPVEEGDYWDVPDTFVDTDDVEYRDVSDLPDEEDYAPFPNGDERVAKAPKVDAPLGVVLGRLLGVDGKDGKVFVGKKGKKFHRGQMKEGEVVSWLLAGGMKKATWEQYKLVNPEMVKDGMVDVEMLKEAAGKPLLRVDVHGAGEAANDTTRTNAALIHEFETVEPDLILVDFNGELQVQVRDAPEGSFLEPANQHDFLRMYDPVQQDYVMLTQRGADIVAQAVSRAHGPQSQGTSDFAAEFGGISPDKFEPFDPETGLGNVAYEVRADGVEGGGGHTGNDDTLAWVRGKFVEQLTGDPDAMYDLVMELYPDFYTEEKRAETIANGNLSHLVKNNADVSPEQRSRFIEKVFRVDEVQSDSAKRSARLEKDRQTLLAYVGKPVGELPAATQEGLFWKISAFETITKDMIYGLLDKGINPLLADYENIGLKTAIQKARENGATKLFLPDSNTAMMTEGHDQYRQDHVQATASSKEEAERIKAQAEDTLGADAYNILQENGQWVVRSKTEGGGFDLSNFEKQLGFKQVKRQPKEAPGMIEAYDVRLPNKAKKVLGKPIGRGDLGVHKESPLQDLTGLDAAAQRVADLTDVSLDQARQAGSSLTTLRKPVLFDYQGNPHTNVTGFVYDLTPKPVQFGGKDGSLANQFVSSPKELITRTLRKGGMSEEGIAMAHPYFAELFRLHGAEGIEMGALLNGELKGAATIKGNMRQLLLGPKGLDGLSDKDKRTMLGFVTGHELSHLTEQLYNNKQLSDRQMDKFKDFVDWTDSADAKDMELSFEIMSEMLPKHLRESGILQEAIAGSGTAVEFRANVMSMWSASRLETPDQVALNMLPPAIRKAIYVLNDIGRAVMGAMRGASNVLPQLKTKLAMRKNLSDMTKMLEKQKSADAKAIEFYTEGAKLIHAGKDADAVHAFWGDKDDVLDDDTTAVGRGEGWINKTVRNFVQSMDGLASATPELRNAVIAVHEFRGRVKADLNKAVAPLLGELDQNGHIVFSTPEDKLHWEMVEKYPAVDKAVSDWGHAMQDVWKNEAGEAINGRNITYGDLKKLYPEIHKRIEALPAKQKEAVVQMTHKIGKSMETFQDAIATTVVTEGNRSMLKGVIGAKRPDLHGDAAGIAELMYEGIQRMGNADPEVRRSGEIALGKAAAKLTGDEYLMFTDMARAGLKEQQALREQFVANRHFRSEIRTGKYLLHWTRRDGVTTGSLPFDNKRDMKLHEKKLYDEGVRVFSTPDMKRNKLYASGKDAIGEFLSDLDQRHKDIINNMAGLTPEQVEVLTSNMDYASHFNKDVTASEVIRQGSGRGLKEGRESLSILKTHLAYLNSATKAVHLRKFNQELNHELNAEALRHPNLEPDVARFKQMVDGFMKPDTELGNGVSMFHAAYFLGMNLSSHAVELTQPAISFVPEMVMQGMSHVASAKMLMKHQKIVADYFGANLPSKIKKGLNKIPGLAFEAKDKAAWSNPAHADVMRFAVERDALSQSHVGDIMGLDVSNNQDSSGLTQRLGEKSKSAMAKVFVTPIKTLAQNSLKFYQQFTEFNTRVALITGYEMAVAKGSSHRRAMEEALVFTRTVAFTGGKANRPVAMSNTEGNWRTTAQSLMSLQGFNLGMLNMMWRYGETAYGKKNYPSITNEQRKRARKALGGMIATQFLGAGLIGMPFMGAAIAAFEAASGVNLEKEMREELAGILDEDLEEDGGMLQDMIMNGAANAIAGKALPGAPDIGSRLSMGGVYGVNAYDGWSIDQAMGPTGSVIKNIATGIQSVTRDKDLGQGLQDIAPIAWKKGIDLLRNGGEFQDRSGGLLVDATFGEKMSYGFGFTPQRVAKMKNFERLQKKTEESERHQDIALSDHLTNLYEKDNQLAMIEMQKLAREAPKVVDLLARGDRQGAEIEYQRALKTQADKIAQRVEKRTFARDPRREGSYAATRGNESLVAAMGQAGNVSEVQRLLSRNQTISRLGVQPSTSPQVMRRAQVIDYLMQKNPNLSKAKAALLADRMLSQSRGGR